MKCGNCGRYYDKVYIMPFSGKPRYCESCMELNIDFDNDRVVCSRCGFTCRTFIDGENGPVCEDCVLEDYEADDEEEDLDDEYNPWVEREIRDRVDEMRGVWA